MVAISWDPQVSRHHAELRRVADAWTIDDDGLSRNGTFVNQERVDGRRRLMDRDVIRVGTTGIAFRTPIADSQKETVSAASPPRIYVSVAQRAVLFELCRPILEGRTGIVSAATNVQIAQRLNLSVETVKQHLRGLFRSFGVSGLPSSQKRTSLARKAVEEGVVSARDLRATRRN
jgi:pSer/pThr/pTyr-binding forkhead associated (FHA) protein